MKKETPTDLKQQIFSWYREWHAVEQLYADWAARYGLSDTALWVLLRIYRHDGPVTQREICQILGMPKQTVSCVLAAMEQKGVLTRARCACDRRSCSITFTPEGKRWADTLFGALCLAEEKAFSGLGQRDRLAFTRINSELTCRLQEALAESPAAAPFPLPDEEDSANPDGEKS